MKQNINFYRIILLLCKLRDSGMFTKQELRKTTTGIAADKGITGTSIDRREDFLRMMEDCRKGRIDRILVKSASRFECNAKESLEAVREPKSIGISVLLEEQNIDTAKTDGEILTVIFAILA